MQIINALCNKILQNYDKNFQPLCFTADYEVAEMKAIKKTFNCSIIGDSFHFAQALYRQIKRLGLTTKVNI